MANHSITVTARIAMARCVIERVSVGSDSKCDVKLTQICVYPIALLFHNLYQRTHWTRSSVAVIYNTYSECKKYTEKIFFEKTLFLKSKYYPARNESSN